MKFEEKIDKLENVYLDLWDSYKDEHHIHEFVFEIICLARQMLKCSKLFTRLEN